MNVRAAGFGMERQPYIENWRPAFRGYQRMRIVGRGLDAYAIEAELDGEIAVGFTGWPETNAFLVGIQELQREPFL